MGSNALHATAAAELRWRDCAARYADHAVIALWDEALAQAALRPGSRVVCMCRNTLSHVALLFLLLDHGLSPLLLAADCPTAERDRYAGQLGAAGVAALGRAGELGLERVLGSYDVHAKAALQTGIYLCTSGSTGTPSMVFRPLHTWRAEAARYRALLGLHAGHTVTLASPVQHAYSLGWVWAAAEAGCALRIFEPTQLAAITDHLRSATTHCALTPFVASLLARRACIAARPPQLEVVMAGAGPVDAALDAQFQQAFGLGLSRNYGSTESGALLAGLAPQESLSIGQLMPHLRLVSTADEDTPFLLDVELEDGTIYHTGDLVRRSGAGFCVVGRATTAIRRGERWISPFEIESVVSAHPHVIDCWVRAVKSTHAGNDHILASVVRKQGTPWDEAALRQFCQARLARSKVPDHFEQVDRIERASNGKVLPSKIYRLAPAAALMQASHGYKRAHLLFALLRSGVLDRLDGERSVDQLAFACGLNADALGHALQLASMLGLVEPPQGVGGEWEDARAVVRLEHHTSQTWNSVDGLLSILRDGSQARPFEGAQASAEFAGMYQDAMRGDHKRVGRMLALRKLRRLRSWPLAMVDISATSGAYSQQLMALGLYDAARSAHALVGRLNVDSGCLPAQGRSGVHELAMAPHAIDLLILDNAVHQGEVAVNLAALCARLAPDGVLIVDELFIEVGNASVGIDWFSHGGLHYPSAASLYGFLKELGWKAEDIYQTDTLVSHRVGLFTRT